MLVIDDEPLLVRLVGNLLADAHHVDTTTRARDALRLVLDGERYDVIFCDMTMPEMSGLEFMDAVARTVPEQARRIVFITGGVVDPAVQSRLADTGVPVLEKPVDIRVLLRLVAEYLALPARRAAMRE